VAVAVQVAEARHGGTEVVVREQAAAEATLRRADLARGLHAAAAVEEQDPHGAGLRLAVVVAGRARGELRDAVAVEVPERRERPAELVAGIQRAREAAARGADLVRGLDRPVAVHEQDPEGAGLRLPVVVLDTGDRDVRDAVAVEVAERGDRAAEAVIVVERAAEAARRLRELHLGVDEGRLRGEARERQQAGSEGGHEAHNEGSACRMRHGLLQQMGSHGARLRRIPAGGP
jgi:hypothetical protein